MADDQLKESYMEYQFLMQHLQQLQQNVVALEKHVSDLKSLNDNLDSIDRTKVDEEVLMPLGNGIFIKGSLKDSKNVVMNVGANVCIEKSVDDAKGTVDKQLNEVSEFLVQLQGEVEKTASRLNELQNKFNTSNEEQ